MLHTLDTGKLSDLLAHTIQALGEVVAFDVKDIYAHVKENSFRAHVVESFKKDQQPKGDSDCRLGVKNSTNQVQSDATTTKTEAIFPCNRISK